MQYLQFLQHQADYITFMYGLAYIMLGCVAFLQRFLGSSRIRWHWMAVFGLLHGLHEWGDLAAFVFPGRLYGEEITLFLSVTSFAALLAFAQDQSVEPMGGASPPSGTSLARKLALPLLIFTAGAGMILFGMNRGAEAFSRGSALLAGCWAAFALLSIRAGIIDIVQKRWLLLAGCSVLIFGVGEGFFEYMLQRQGAASEWAVLFRAVQGVLALSIMGAVWGFIYRSRKVGLAVDSPNAAEAPRMVVHYTTWLTASLALVVGVGWYVTDQLGKNGLNAIRLHSSGDTEILATHLRDQMTRTEMLAALLAKSSTIRKNLDTWNASQNGEAKNAMLKYVAVLENASAFLMRPNGVVLASTEGVDAGHRVGESFGFLPFFQDSAAYGLIGKDLAVEPDGNSRGYYVSHPVHSESGGVLGIAVVKMVLSKPTRWFDGGHDWFLINPAGVVFIASRPDMSLKPLWPLSEATRQILQRSKELGPGTFEGGAMPFRPSNHAVVQWNGRASLINIAPIRPDGWSAVLIENLDDVAAQRFYGILVTIAVALFTLSFFVVLHRESAFEAKMADDQRRLTILNAELERQASTDGLTGLFNRQKFNALLNGEIDRACRYGSVFTLVIFDVDHFKRINDTWGHQVGDLVLCNLTRLAGDTARSSDALARWGGEEFAAILPMTDLVGAVSFAERMREALAQFNFEPVPKVSCSFGITAYSAGDDIKAIVQRADLALYQAKESGRDRVEICLAAPEGEAA